LPPSEKPDVAAAGAAGLGPKRPPVSAGVALAVDVPVVESAGLVPKRPPVVVPVHL
jgi:hypothetical protein